MIWLLSLWGLRYVNGVWHLYCDATALIGKLKWLACVYIHICYVNTCWKVNVFVIDEIICMVHAKLEDV